MTATETTAKDTTAKGGDVNELELTAEELDAATGGVLPDGFLIAVEVGIAKGVLDSGGSIAVRPS